MPWLYTHHCIVRAMLLAPLGTSDGSIALSHTHWTRPVQVFGGLIVGMVVKYADNIVKNFANALSVIFTVVGAVPLFHQYPSGWFILGVAFVILSVCMYGKSTPAVSPYDSPLELPHNISAGPVGLTVESFPMLLKM